MKSFATFLLTILLQATIFATNGIDNLQVQKQCFSEAKAELENMLSGKSPLDYERAVFVTENAYWNNAVDYANFESIIDIYVNNIKILTEINRKEQNFKATLTESVEQQQEAYNNLLYNWAIYTYLTDTITILAQKKLFYHTPCQYSTSDPFGSFDWKNSQVFSLLNPYNKTANCYAQASFFRILAGRLQTDAQLGVAPGHTYITHTDPKGIHYNIELPTRSFPGAGSIMTLTYTPIEAVQSGIAMRSLDLKQSVALCLVYLAKGYEHRFNIKADGFVLQCAETALQYDPLNLNAMLLKAEVLEEKIISSGRTMKQLQNDEVFNEYQNLITSLYEKGYREMPTDMKNAIINRFQKDSAGLILTDHTPKGFQTISPKNDRYATLSWGTFDEVHEPKRLEQYGRTVFDTKTKHICKFKAEETLYNDYDIDPVVSAWQIDPLAAKFPHMSPYAALSDNPILFVDPTGESATVFITADESKGGDESTNEDAFNQLQSSTNLKLSRDKKTGQVTATGTAQNEDDKQLLAAINNPTVQVNIKTDRALHIGSFEGNTLTPSPENIETDNKPFTNIQIPNASNSTVSTTQSVNPIGTATLDEINNTPGKSILHETTESYIGGLIAMQLGISIGAAWHQYNSNGVEIAHSPYLGIYNQAHNQATPQPGGILTPFEYNCIKSLIIFKTIWPNGK